MSAALEITFLKVGESCRAGLPSLQQKLSSTHDPKIIDECLTAIEGIAESDQESPDDICDGYLEGIIKLMIINPNLVEGDRFDILIYTGLTEKIIYALSNPQCQHHPNPQFHATVQELFTQIHNNMVSEGCLSYLNTCMEQAPQSCDQAALQWVIDNIKITHTGDQ